VRRIQSERRASGELVHVELTPGAVTIICVECEMDRPVVHRPMA
jgi:hypothetical protein